MAAAKVMQHLSQKTIARQLGVHRSYLCRWIKRESQTASVRDKPKAQRGGKVTPAVMLALQGLVKGNPTHSTRLLAHKLSAQCAINISKSTVHRAMKAAGLVCETARKVPFLTPTHKQKRVKFCRRHLSTLKTPWAPVMVSDSKIFLLRKPRASSGTRCWYWKSARPTEPVVQKSQGVHVYLGVTNFGVTGPIFVTGAGGQASPYDNPSSKEKHRGCCAREYCDKVLPVLISDGDRLFAGSQRWRTNWIFQQDGARPHTARITKQLLGALMPNRVMSDWPASSPDLSWIENLWGWCDQQLRQHCGHISTIEELRAAVQKVIASIPSDMLKNYVRGMPGRLQKCLEVQGANIGR